MVLSGPSPQARGGNPWFSSLDKVASASRRLSLLEDAAWVALEVPIVAAEDGGLPVFPTRLASIAVVVMWAAA